MIINWASRINNDNFLFWLNSQWYQFILLWTLLLRNRYILVTSVVIYIEAVYHKYLVHMNTSIILSKKNTSITMRIQPTNLTIQFNPTRCFKLVFRRLIGKVGYFFFLGSLGWIGLELIKFSIETIQSYKLIFKTIIK